MAVNIMLAHPRYDYHYSLTMYTDNFKVGRSSLSNITSTWAKERFPTAKYVANYTIINVVTGEVDFLQVYF